MGCTYELSQTAYIKIVLHALKNPSSAVNGILLGRPRTYYIMEILDAMPVSHSASNFYSPFQIALYQTEEQCYHPRQLNVVGYYHANETYDDCKLGPAACKHVDQMFRHSWLSAVLLLDHKKLHHLIKENDGDPAVMLFTCGISRTPCLQAGPEAKDELVLKEPSAHALLADYIASKKWLEIVDFEDHLNDITKDWFNPNLFK
ncbi:ER membrane protein complex subunit 8/9 homolog [Carex rostrata]